MHAHRTTEKIVGALFLAAIATYGTGSGLIESLTGASDVLAAVSGNNSRMEIGAFLMLLNSVAVAAIGVMMFPLLKTRSSHIAFGYFAARIVESTVLAVGIVLLYLLLPISQANVEVGASADSNFRTLTTLATEGNTFAYQIAMVSLALGSLPFCYLLYQSRLLPHLLAAWGFVGYAIFLAGAVMELFGFGVGLVLSIPGGLFELALGIWLIAKGFNASAVPHETATTAGQWQES